jgi:hypothetical protein
MKKIAALLIVLSFLTSCATTHRGRVCGGAGGQRCVENSAKKETVISTKRNS